MKKQICWAAMCAMSFAAGASQAEESQPPYENGGYYEGQTWNPVAAMVNLPAQSMQIVAQAMNTAMKPMMNAYKDHPYLNGGVYGDKASEVAMEVR